MKIEQYDRILLKDGRTASVVEILEEGSAYLVDVDLPGPDWDTIQIRQNDILTNIESQTQKEPVNSISKNTKENDDIL